jgi:hypothetical protein
MPDHNPQSLFLNGDVNSQSPLEVRLRQLFAQQVQLREQLETTRAELDRVNAEVLRTQEDWSRTLEGEAEYNECMKRICGYDLQDVLREIEEAKKNPQSIEDLIAELEKMGS